MTGDPLGAQRVEPAATSHPEAGPRAGDGPTGRDPFPTGLQRFGAASGIGAALFLFLSIAFSSGEFPDFGDPAGDWLSYADEESSGLGLSSVSLALAAFELVFFAGYLRDALGQAEARARGHARLAFVVLGGMVLAATCLTTGAAAQALWAAQETGAEPEVAKVFGQLAGALVVASAPGFAVALLAAGILIIRTRPLAAWLGWVALLSGALFFISIFFLLDPGSDENITGFAYFLGFVVLLVWLIGASVSLIRRIGQRSAPPPA